MERHLQIKNKRIFKKLFFAFLGLLFSVNFSVYSQASFVERIIRIPLWAELDAYPESEQAANINSEQYEFPINRMHEVAPFIINGMVYGWNFVYVPSDKARGVEEYFEVTEITDSEVTKNKINYTSPWIENNKLNCWVEYERTEAQVQNYRLWTSIKNPVISGLGYAAVEKGFDGIEEAAKDSLKTAIRDYYRSIIKNKPKEINGSVLIRNLGALGIDSGRYVINLAFFLECGKIIEYSVY